MSSQKNEPLILYCCRGIVHLIYAIWSIRSLQRFNYDLIEIIVSNDDERQFVNEKITNIACRVINADTGKYPKFSYKPFVLIQYFEKYGAKLKQKDVVVCDADVIWMNDPKAMFARFEGKNWVHKITALDPLDFDILVSRVKRSNIGLRTIQNYEKRFAIVRYPNFIVNAGLFMLPGKIMLPMLQQWMKKILSLPPKEMLLSEALMALTYAEMGLTPVSDKDDVKHLGIENKETLKELQTFSVVETRASDYTGYQTAKHYFGDQRENLHQYVRDSSLDPDGLMGIVIAEIKKNKFKNWSIFLKKKLKKII